MQIWNRQMECMPREEIEILQLQRLKENLHRVYDVSPDMMVIRGVNVFPSQIESVLVNIEGLSPNYQIIRYKKGFLEDI